MFYGAPTMDLLKKPPEVASRKRSETVENKAFSCNGADFKKETTPPNLTIIDKYAKTLRKINVFEGVAGDDPGTSKTNLGP